MRNLYIVLSILCFSLSGVITFKALNLPVETLQNTNSQLDQKLANESVLLGDIAFKFGQFALDENMEKFIEQSAQHILAFYPNCRVIVEGHADNEGAEEYNNMDISSFRAKAVALEFEKQEISFKRISVTGYGETHPFASNDTAEGRAKNRRVVVRLIPEEKEI
jgi:outer membrane protein OmpA-like peptidoglycan-associated protein